MSLLALNWNIIYIFINIIVLFLFLKKFLFGPVTEIMEKRTQSIADSINDAEAKKEEAYKLRKDYEDELNKAGRESIRIIKDARDRAELEYNRTINEAKEEAAKIIQEANKSIELERNRAILSAQAEIASIALLAASKVIGKNVDDSMNKQYLGNFIKEVGASK